MTPADLQLDGETLDAIRVRAYGVAQLPKWSAAERRAWRDLSHAAAVVGAFRLTAEALECGLRTELVTEVDDAAQPAPKDSL